LRIQIASIPACLQAIAKSNVGPGLLSYILISKYEDHLPLHRKRKIFLRDKIDIPESTIGNWTRQSLNLLNALYQNYLKTIKLENYLLDGQLETDNNWIENKIRPLAISCKNYMFAGSHQAATRACSFLAMCRVAEVNPSDWLKDVLGRIQDHPINKISELLPRN